MSLLPFDILVDEHHLWRIAVICCQDLYMMQSMILIEIQDTMAQPPSEEKSMKKATHTGIAITVRNSAMRRLLPRELKYLGGSIIKQENKIL